MNCFGEIAVYVHLPTWASKQGRIIKVGFFLQGAARQGMRWKWWGFWCLNNKIELIDLNDKIESFKMKMKKLFLE